MVSEKRAKLKLVWNIKNQISDRFSGLKMPWNFHLSNEVDFHTKSTTKLWVHSTGAPRLLRNSIPTSSPKSDEHSQGNHKSICWQNICLRNRSFITYTAFQKQGYCSALWSHDQHPAKVCVILQHIAGGAHHQASISCHHLSWERRSMQSFSCWDQCPNEQQCYLESVEMEIYM